MKKVFLLALLLTSSVAFASDNKSKVNTQIHPVKASQGHKEVEKGRGHELFGENRSSTYQGCDHHSVSRS